MPGPRPVLIIDDDAALAGTWPSSLRMEGECATSVATTLAEASALFAAPGARFDLVLLDVRLPDGDGREFCVRLRRTGHRMPVIMLTGSDSESDVVSGLDAGGQRYIAKPFRLNELLARMRAQTARLRQQLGCGVPPRPVICSARRPSSLQDEAKGKRIR